MTISIVEFLEARIAEDEADALAAIDDDRPGTHWQWVSAPTDEVLDASALQSAARWEAPEGLMMSLRTVEHFPTTSGVGPLPAFPLQSVQWDGPSGVYQHIARHDPARVLAECKAKRSVIEQHNAHEERVRMALDLDLSPAHANERRQATHAVLRALTQPYADHPDFDPAWG